MILALLVLIAAGCASVPDADDEIAEAAATSQASPTLLGAGGILNASQSRHLLNRVANEAEHDAVLERHLAVEQAIARTPLTAGNSTELLRNGDGAFAAIFKAIAGARRHVNLEYYTLEDVVYDGRHLSDLLIAKRQAGIAVNIIYDAYGSSNTPSEFFARLKDAGVNLLAFHPVNPLEAVAGGYSPNDRNHRKIMIVDGTVAVVGGVNLASYYQSKTPGGGSKAGAQTSAQDSTTGKERPENWRDLSMRIEGPAVKQLQGLFLGHWNSEHGPALDQTDFFPDRPANGSEIVRIIGSSPEQDASRYYVALISAIRNAQSTIWLTTAYFVPTFEEKHELIYAAERGVDVRLMLPAVSDASQAIAVAHSHYSDLLEAGVRIFELDDVVLHSKAVTIDGVWSAVGSSNFDHRSVLFNDEVEAIVLGRKTAAGLERVFEEDRAQAKEISLEQWRKRPLPDRLGDFFQRSLQYLL
ncbi:MAG TPA: phospholipase D-like domain-containing protein [Dongiaceae bacterium]|nr:phospholipase D-like domain-containing protein [Dongiaceae bacterium]